MSPEIDRKSNVFSQIKTRTLWNLKIGLKNKLSLKKMSYFVKKIDELLIFVAFKKYWHIRIFLFFLNYKHRYFVQISFSIV